MDFRSDEPLTPEDAEEHVTRIIEALQARGLQVPGWIITKCRERVIKIAEPGFTGRLKLSLEVIRRQVADVDIIETDGGTT